MVLTTQRQSMTNLIFLSQSVNDVAPQLNGAAEHVHISDTVETHFSTGKSNADTVWYVQEADFPL